MKSAELNITSPYSKFGRIKVLYICSFVRLGILFPIAFSIPNFLFVFVEMWLAQNIWLLIVNPTLVCSDTSSNNILLKVICIFACGRFLFVTSINGYFVPNSFQYTQLPICFCGDVASPEHLVTDS